MSARMNALVRDGIAAASLLLFMLQPLVSHAGWLESVSDWFDENMIDAEDSKMDISDYLSGTTGFLPVPIIITEPAVGFGGGAGRRVFSSAKRD